MMLRGQRASPLQYPFLESRAEFINEARGRTPSAHACIPLVYLLAVVDVSTSKRHKELRMRCGQSV